MFEKWGVKKRRLTDAVRRYDCFFIFSTKKRLQSESNNKPPLGPVSFRASRSIFSPSKRRKLLQQRVS